MSHLTQPLIAVSPVDSALEDVCAFLLSKSNFVEAIGQGLRKSFDEVIDGARTGRYRIEQLEKTEKTYIGTKVEILLRTELALERGNILDNLIVSHEVDTKFSLSGGWMIPREAIGRLCLLVQGDDNSGRFSVGILRMLPTVLTNGANQDGKKSVSAAGKLQIRWLVHSAPLPPNFLLHLPDEVRTRIMSQSSGLQRIAELFRSVTGQLIPRTAITQVAQQHDPLRRARQMKDHLATEGFEILCATYIADRSRFVAHGFSNFSSDDWLSIRRVPAIR